MAQKINRRFFVLGLALMVLAPFSSAQDYKPLLGKWSMTSENTGDPIKWTLTLKEVGGKLSAILQTGDGEKPARNVTFADGILKFEAPYQDAYYDIELKVTADKLDGTWDGDDGSGKTYGTKN